MSTLDHFEAEVLQLLALARLSPSEKAQVRNGWSAKLTPLEVADDLRRKRAEKALRLVLAQRQVDNDPAIAERAAQLLREGLEPDKAVEQASRDVAQERKAAEAMLSEAARKAAAKAKKAAESSPGRQPKSHGQ